MTPETPSAPLQMEEKMLSNLRSYLILPRRVYIPANLCTSLLSSVALQNYLCHQSVLIIVYIFKLNLRPKTLIVASFVGLSALMAFQMPAFLSRFMRPFSSATSISYQADSLGALNVPANTQRATFAGGCFWGVEELYRKNFGKGKGLLDCRVGYTGGHTENPTYGSTCSGRTGHAESLLILFDPDVVSYRKLVEFFFRMHDPTTLNRQGADSGSQYRSAVFANSEEQLKIAEEIKEKVGKEWYKGQPITTEVAMAGKWYDAEKEHQDYLTRVTRGYHCPAHYARPFAPLSE